MARVRVRVKTLSVLHIGQHIIDSLLRLTLLPDIYLIHSCD